MASMSLQFHATRSEVAGWMTTWARDLGTFMAAEKFFPDYTVHQLDVDSPEDSAILDSADRLALSRNAFNTDATTTIDFLDKNPGILTVLVEDPRDEGLRESMLSASADDPDTLAMWSKVRTRVKSSMFTGATVFSPYNQTAAPAPRGHRFSAGARALAHEGVTLLAIAGNVQFKLDD
jgi:hypothetical protein